MDKIKSLEEQLIETKTEVKKLTNVKLVVEPNSKEKKKVILLHLKGIMKS